MKNKPMLTTIYPIEGTVEVGTSKVIMMQPDQGAVPTIRLPGTTIVPNEMSLGEGGDNAEKLREILMGRIDAAIARLLTTHDTVCVTSRGPIRVEDRPDDLYYAHVIISLTGLNLRSTEVTYFKPQDFVEKKAA